MPEHCAPYGTLRERITADLNGIAEILDTSTDGLVLERLPNGEHAWLRPEPPAGPRSALTRWCERLHGATRFIMPKGWTTIDVPIVPLEDLLP